MRFYLVFADNASFDEAIPMVEVAWILSYPLTLTSFYLFLCELGIQYGGDHLLGFKQASITEL
jgi:membrane-anchored protein YejM (alkaline phosphatase superfamily)